LERNVHRSQNRIESYHQLRSALAQIGGKKELTGRTDIEIEISNQCARLIANAIIYYNSAILSRLLTKYEASGSTKALTLIKKISPAAWRHIHLNGHYTFRGDGLVINLDTIVAGLSLVWRKNLGFGLTPPFGQLAWGTAAKLRVENNLQLIDDHGIGATFRDALDRQEACIERARVANEKMYANLMPSAID
jgi:Tn3 transposase DDE domain